MRREPFGRVKGIGGRVAGCTRWEREGKTDSRNKTWVAPESARIGEGVIEHKRAGEGGSSPSESYGDSRAAKGLGGKMGVGLHKGEGSLGKGGGSA